jgi:two-component system, NarL family, sensor histidine kinase DesK
VVGGRAAAAAGLVVFAALYVPAVLTAWFRPDDAPDPLGVLAACTLIGAALVLAFGPAWSGLLVYSAHLAGAVIRPLGTAVAAVTAIGLLSAGCSLLIGGGPLAALFGVGYDLLVGLYAVAFGRVVATYRELDRARQDQARLAVADERLRFARDLHDLLGQSLSVIALKSELAGRLVDRDPERARAEVRDIEAVTREALAEVRAAVTGYRGTTGLAAELRRARSALAAAGVEARIDEPADPLPPAVEDVLAWTVREGTTNIIRHAGARRAAIRLHSDRGGAGVELVDDGGGAAPGPLVPADGNGLQGLAERVAAAAGAFEAGGAPDGGFRLAVRVPR